MRERVEIEKEMFEARQDLEENVEKLVHKVRETAAVKERAKHAIEEKTGMHPAVFALAVVGVAVLLMVLKKIDD